MLLKRDILISVRICSSIDMLEKLLEIGKVKVLLISEDIPYERRKQFAQGKRIVLTKQQCRDLGQDEVELFKYQGADQLLAAILNAYQGEVRVLTHVRKDKVKIIGVYSPVHRIGKTTLSLKLGKFLSEQENVLYLNLETYAGFGGYFRDENGQDFSHLLYYARQDHDDLSVRIASMVKPMGNMDYVPPMKIWTDLRSVTPSEWKQFLEKLMTQSIYHTVVLDIGNAVETPFELLKMCNIVLTPYATDVYANAKIEQYKYMLQTLQYTEIEQRTIYINMERPMRQIVREVVQEFGKQSGKESRHATGRATS